LTPRILETLNPYFWSLMEDRLLLVDDEDGIRKVLSIALADSGYVVLTAGSGEEALEIFRKEQPPVVLTDIKMPGMGGIALLKAIKKESPDTEVIMISGHGDMDLAIESLKSEAVDFVTKPINDDVLSIALKRAREKIDTRQQLRQYTDNLEKLVAEKTEQLLEAERQLAVGQAVEGLTTAMRNMAGDFENGITYFNEMPCFVAIHNQQLKIVATNQRLSLRLGDLRGQSSHLVYADLKDPDQSPAAQTFKSGQGQRKRAVIRYKDEQEVPVIVHTAPIRSKNGDVELVVEIIADISEVKKLQDELRNTQQRFEQLFDMVPCYISVQNRDFKLTAANRLFKQDFGDETGSHCYAVYKHRNTPCPNCPVDKTFKDGKSHQAEMVVTAKSGEQANVLIWTAPIRDADGAITQVMEVSTNITQVRKLQDHLSSLGLKISSISHGIKGLLSGLDGGIYMMDTGFAKNNKQRVDEGWDIIKTIVGRIRKLVLDILYFAKERDLRLDHVDILNFAEDVVTTVQPKMRKHGIDFKRVFDPELGKLEVDAGVLGSGLINILENAIDACMDDATKDVHSIRFEIRQEKDHIIFVVADDGIGMDQETRENLFTLFFSSKGSKGTGLGLFITNRIIEQHGGSIKVESEPDKGACFTIALPKEMPADIKKEPTAEEMLFCKPDENE
jgi:PAS domain S-box-containing protein